MKMYKSLFLLFFLSSSCSADIDRKLYWDNLLSNPDKMTFEPFADAISENTKTCGWGKKENLMIVPVDKGQKLYKLIAKGNEYAFRAGLLVLKCLDGGELGDFHRSGGLLFEENKDVFLKVAKEGLIPKSNLKSMLVMLPLNSVDDFDQQISIVQKRIAILNEDSFKDLKKIYLTYLEQELENIKKVKIKDN